MAKFIITDNYNKSLERIEDYIFIEQPFNEWSAVGGGVLTRTPTHPGTETGNLQNYPLTYRCRKRAIQKKLLVS